MTAPVVGIKNRMIRFFSRVYHLFRDHVPLLVLVGIYVAVRWFLICTPMLSESVMDEAITGLIAMAAQHGHIQVFWWGQAYMGNVEAWSAALLFSLTGPSLLSLRITLVAWGVLGLVSLYGWGCQVGGRRGREVGFWAAAWWALPPVAGSFHLVIPLGGHVEALSLAAVALWGCSNLAFGQPRRPWLVGLLTGFAGGVSFYSSLLAAPLLLAGALCLLGAKPRLLLSSPPWLGLMGFALGSAPFWWWNLRHHWLTFVHFQASHGHLWENFRFLAYKIWLPFLLDGGWEDADLLRWLVLLLIYIPILVLLVGRVWVWLGRLWRRQLPWRQPLDLACLCLGAALLAHAASQYGHEDAIRYAVLLMVPLAIQVGYALAWLRQKLPALGLGLACLLLAFNAGTHAHFLEGDAGKPRRRVDLVISKLEELGLDHCWAHPRTAYPIWFESQGRILAAPWGGWRNYTVWREVEAAPRMALVAEPRFGVHPPFWRKSLKTLGVSFREDRAGSYHIFHDFNPEPTLRPLDLSQGKICDLRKSGSAKFLLDRKPCTIWSSKGAPGAGLTLDLGREVSVARVTLLPSADERGNGRLLTVSLMLSSDGHRWRYLMRKGLSLTGLVWYGDHPRMSNVPVVQLTFPPHRARYLRIVLDEAKRRSRDWRFCELFVDQPALCRESLPRTARRHLLRARKELYRYYQDPTGPSPGWLTIPLTVRNHLVAWPYVFCQLRQAMRLAPTWSKPYLLWLRAVQMGDWQGRILPRSGLLLDQGWASAFLIQRPEGTCLRGLSVEGQGELSYKVYGVSGRMVVRAGQTLRLEIPPAAAQSKPPAERLVVRCLAGKVALYPLPAHQTSAHLVHNAQEAN